MGALIIGIIVSIICFFAIRIKHKIGADDALDVFGVHGCGGTWGSLATGLFAVAAFNGLGHDGLLNGGTFASAIVPQLKDIGATVTLAVVGTCICAGLTHVICGGLRTTAEGEEAGLDLADHGETGYSGENAGTAVATGSH
jgi:Amt family ammonium transporter